MPHIQKRFIAAMALCAATAAGCGRSGEPQLPVRGAIFEPQKQQQEQTSLGGFATMDDCYEVMLAEMRNRQPATDREHVTGLCVDDPTGTIQRCDWETPSILQCGVPVKPPQPAPAG